MTRPSDTLFVCPAHPDETDDQLRRCPRCGRKLLPAHFWDLPRGDWYYCPDHPQSQSPEPGCCLKCRKEMRRVEPKMDSFS
jgi:hypothetical protein